MKHYPKIKNQQIEAEAKPDPVVSDISIDSLIDNGLLVLYREVKQLLALSSKGKLASPDARDLRDHLKLLFELKDREGDTLKNLSDEELEKILENRKNADE